MMASHLRTAKATNSKSSDDESLHGDGSDLTDEETMALKNAKRSGSESATSESKVKAQESEDVVRLSHVASIEVKDTGTDNGEPPRRSSSPVTETMGRGGNRGRFTTSSRSHMEDGKNGDSASECAPMHEVQKSPYEPDLNAEKGVRVFSDMKKLLSDNSYDNYRSVDPKAAKIFGPTNAWCLVKANGKL